MLLNIPQENHLVQNIKSSKAETLWGCQPHEDKGRVGHHPGAEHHNWQQIIAQNEWLQRAWIQILERERSSTTIQLPVHRKACLKYEKRKPGNFINT